MGKPFAEELQRFPSTYLWALSQNVKEFQHFLDRWKGEHVAVVGSGGSFSAAVVASLFREIGHGSATTAVTPHEFPGLCDRVGPRTLLLSAEGKNKDILHAAQVAAQHDLSTAVLTLTRDTPISSFAARTKTLCVFQFQADWVKDGYLATNSLLATAVLLYRVVFGDSRTEADLSVLFEPMRLAQRRSEMQALINGGELRRRGVLLLYSAQAKSFAIDIESKLAESALAAVQMCDLRQFAHGRHLQLHVHESPPVVMIACSTAERALAEATRELLPDHAQSILVELTGSSESAVAISGLVDAMYVTEVIAQGAEYDPGAPFVPSFGRAIHSLDPSILLKSDDAADIYQVAAMRKAKVRKPQIAAAHLVDAAKRYARRLADSNVKAVVCDFDGTLCRTENRFSGIDELQVEWITSLMDSGMQFAIATGRGESIHRDLRERFDARLHASILIGYYGGSYVDSLDQPFIAPGPNSEFEELWNWLKTTSIQLPEKPWTDYVRGGQMGVRLSSRVDCRQLRELANVWAVRTGRTGWRAFCSGHSVDVLDSSTSKLNLLRAFSARYSLNPETEILKIGDCGQEDGNDFELLNGGLSLSCEGVSAALDSCWNFGALGTNQADVTLQYLQLLSRTSSGFRFSVPVSPSLERGQRFS